MNDQANDWTSAFDFRQSTQSAVLITTDQGRPYTEKGFGNWMSDAATKAGLPHCSAHGLRKAAARRLAEAGCTAHEIMSVTGHQSLKEAERYTRETARKLMGDRAIARVEGTEVEHLRLTSANRLDKREAN